MLSPRLATHRIVARATSLYERSSADLSVVGPAPAERIAAWSRRVDPLRERLDLRRAFDDLPEAERALADVELEPDAPLPSWATLLETVAGRAGRGPAQRRRYFVENNPAPFQEILAHFVDEGFAELQTKAGRALDRVSLATQDKLQARLLRYLGWLATASLRVELRLHCQRHESSWARLARRARKETSTRHYQGFVTQLCADGMQRFFAEYSALARAVGTAVLQWIDAQAELLLRLDEDWDALLRAFAGDRHHEQIHDLEGGLSDRHDGGRSVVIVTLGDGTRVVYKPRPLGIEAAWSALLEWFAADGAPFTHRSLRVLTRERHGWVEFVDAEPCEDQAQVVRFYERLGAMLAILHAFEATDCHYENVIAAGPDPVLIDAETVMHPRFVVRPGPSGTGAQAQAREQQLRSVQRPGLLPQWTVGADGKSVDISGAGASEGQLSDREFMGWEGINTDDFELRPMRLPLGGGSHAATLGVTTASVVDHQEVFRAGFERMYRYLMGARSRIVAEGGPLRAFEGQRVRVVLRPTRLYSDLLDNANHPDLMRDGIDRGIHFDLLGRPPGHGERPPYWDSVRVEHEALTRLDIPSFYAPTDRAELRTGQGRIVSRDFLQAAPLDGVRERLRSLSADDLALQLRYIEASFYSRNGRVEHGHEVRGLADEGESGGGGESEGGVRGVDPASVDLLAEAEQIGDALADAALEAEDGSITWVAHEHHFGTDAFHLGPSSTLLYGGSVGVGLFFAALFRATGHERWRARCHATLAHVYAEIDGGFVEGTLPWTTGGLTGDGALVYALAKVGEYLDDPRVFRRAEAVVERIAEHYADDEELDVTKGNAGAILGLLRLHSITGSSRALEVARACGEHLLSAVVGDPEQGERRWLPGQERPLAGLSHGAAGFALAFARLWDAHPDPRLREAIDIALAYEQTAFVPERRNWLDLREADEHGRYPAVSSWCHGAPGIGLSRAAMLSILGPAAVREDLDHALATTEGCGLAGEGNVCCGVFGRLEAMLSMGRAIDRSETIARVEQWTAGLVMNARTRGGYSLLAGLPRDALQIGLYDGLSGVGFHLLRVHSPDAIGAFMLWD